MTSPFYTQMRSTRGSARAGFTMIEALVAFTVLSVMTLAVQRAVFASMGSSVRAETRVHAEMVARTLMTGPLGFGPTSLQPRSGDMNGLRWTMRFEPVKLSFPMVGTPDGKRPAWVPLRMVVEIFAKGGDRPNLVVKTIRLLKVGLP